jgi:hypothetical protein
MNLLIDRIEKSCGVLFLNSTFKFNRNSLTKYVLKGDFLTQAINHIRNDKAQVSVLHWFEDFWIYIEMIIIKEKENFTHTSISISIFQGAADDNVKNQLFRAEWDNYENNTVHPQPHWHVYPFKYDVKTYEDFEAYNELINESNIGFEASIINKKASKIIDISDFHFAMNGQWVEHSNHIHRITEDNAIVLWLTGVLTHIKDQLSFIK